MRHTVSPQGRRRWSPLVATVLAVVLVASACTDDNSDPASPDQLADGMSHVSQGLPADPGRAAEQLVDSVLDDSPERAAAAAAELLRRSGLPVVMATGPVVAMPDALVLYDSPVYAELIPALVTATRARDRYTVDQVATVLTSVGLTTRNLTFAEMTTALADWGKTDGGQPVFATAAAAVRALSGRRGQVLYPRADEATTYLDPLQTVLVVAHATSRFGLVTGANPTPKALGLLDRLIGTGVAYAEDEGGGPCAAFLALFETDDPVVKANSDFLKDQLKDRMAGAVLKEGAKEVFDKFVEAWGKAGASISAMMLMLGARLQLTADKTGTHYKHQAGSKAEHVTLTALATFDIQIAAKKLECYALAGVSIPKAGPLEGFTIRWSSDQDQRGTIQEGGNAHLITVSADSAKVTHGARTGADGKATLEVKPPVEDPPGAGSELKGWATYTASLDKENFPFELGDIFSVLGGPFGFAVAKSFDLVKDVLTRAGLPSQTITIAVDYHGSDIIVAKGHGTVELILARIDDVYVDLVSCTGIAGPFTGTGGFGGSTTEWIRTARLLGIEVPDGGAGAVAELSFPTNPAADNQFLIMKGAGGKQFIDGVLSFYPPASTTQVVYVKNSDVWQVGRPVGELEILIAGNSNLFGALVFPVVRVTADPRCKAVKYAYDNA